MPRSIALIFIKVSLKLSYFFQKNTKFSRAELCPTPSVPAAAMGFSPRPPVISGGWDSAPNPPRQRPIARFWLRACQ